MQRMRIIIFALIVNLMLNAQLAADKIIINYSKEKKMTEVTRKVAYSDIISNLTLPNDGSRLLGFDLNGKFKGEELYDKIEYMLQQIKDLEIQKWNYKEDKKRYAIFRAKKKIGFKEKIDDLFGNVTHRFTVKIQICKDDTYEKLPVIIEIYYGFLSATWLTVYDMEVNYPFLKDDVYEMINNLYQKIHPDILLVED